MLRYYDFTMPLIVPEFTDLADVERNAFAI